MKVRNKWLTLCLILIVAALSGSCEKPYHQQNEHYYLVSANINLPYWQDAEAGFMDAASHMGVKADFMGPDSYDPQAELTEFKKVLAQHPSGILVSPAQPALFTDAIDSAIKQGIPVICVDSDDPESRRLMFVGTDNVQAGIQSAEVMAKLVNGKGNIVVITIPGQLNLDQRLQGVQQVFQKYPNLKITKTLNDKGDPEVANEGISDLMAKNEKVDGVLCLEASGGSGTAEVMHRLNLEGKFPIVAMDKSSETYEWISKGVISATVIQKPYTMAFYGIRFLDDFHHDVVHEFKNWQTAPVSPLPARVDTGTAVVTSKNLAEFQSAEAIHHQQP
jgi:ribose transport system substrate-binding protein